MKSVAVSQRVHRVGVINNQPINPRTSNERKIGIYGMWFFVGQSVDITFLRTAKKYNNHVDGKFIDEMKRQDVTILCKTGTTEQKDFRQRISTQVGSARYRTGSGQKIPFAVHDALAEDESLSSVIVPVALTVVPHDPNITDVEYEHMYAFEPYFKPMGVIPNNAQIFERKSSVRRQGGTNFKLNLTAWSPFQGLS